MSLLDKLKGTVDEVVENAKTAVSENTSTINSVIDTVTSTADARTGGKYSDKIAKLSETAKGGLGSFAAGEPTGPAAPAGASGTRTSTTPSPASTAPVADAPVPDAEAVDDA